MFLEDVVHGCNVSVTEARCPFSFFEEAVAIERVGAQRRGQTLERDGALELGIFGAIDLAHSTLAKTIADAETPDHSSTQGILWLGRTRQRWLTLRHKRVYGAD
jgi:hypothetical protein